MELTTARALVTGGAQGMGRTFATQIAAAGGKVVFCDINPESVARTREETGLPGVVGDVSSEADVARLFDEAEALLGGPVNVLVNNAGITRDGLLVKVDRETGAVSTLSKAAWDAVIGVNLTGVFLCMREMAARCVKTGTKPAVAVNMSSISRAGNRGQSNYSAAKAGLVADTKLWGEELARFGIRVGAIAPGFIDTPMIAAMRPDALAKVTAPVPLGRVGKPEEIWLAVKFIIECDYFTGRVVEVDGGLVV